MKTDRYIVTLGDLFMTPRRKTKVQYESRSMLSKDISAVRIFQTKGAASNSGKPDKPRGYGKKEYKIRKVSVEYHAVSKYDDMTDSEKHYAEHFFWACDDGVNFSIPHKYINRLIQLGLMELVSDNHYFVTDDLRDYMEEKLGV